MPKKHKVMNYAAARRMGRFASGLAQTPLSCGVHFLLLIELIYFRGGCLNARRSRALVYSSTRHSAKVELFSFLPILTLN